MTYLQNIIIWWFFLLEILFPASVIIAVLYVYEI